MSKQGILLFLCLKIPFPVFRKEGKKKLARFVMYPNLVAEMARAGETTEDLGKMLELDRSQVYRKIHGQAKWTLNDVYVLCEHYKMDCYKLFKKNERKGKKNENNTKN